MRSNNTVEIFSQQLQLLQGRLLGLYQSANVATLLDRDLLPTAYKELGIASEELQVAIEEMHQQEEELVSTRSDLEAERQRYRELFDFAPEAYLVTDDRGKILEANRAASRLLNVAQKNLAGKPLVVFIAQEQRWNFRTQINQQFQSEEVKEWEVLVQPRHGEPFDATLKVVSSGGVEGKPLTLRWMLRQSTDRQQAFNYLEGDRDISFGRSLHTYSKGEIIPLSSQVIWQVSQGLVKLTTNSEAGEEVLVGLAGQSMIFGADFTSLMTYQATALSKQVKLAYISLNEIAASPHLAQALLPQMKRRLQQTELLLSISGNKRVQDRLQQLLLILKKEIGQPTPEGARLNVRLTHEDLASACCTTRVTMTRLLNEFQKQGTIAFDSQRHIILRDGG